MKWFDSYKYRPKHGTQIFLWDMNNQKQLLFNAFWDPENWIPQPWFPFWAYVLEGIEPDLIVKEDKE
jgi:hypothetical protein